MSGGISAKCHVASLGLRDAGIEELLPGLSCASTNVLCKTVRLRGPGESTARQRMIAAQRIG
jgi:hypothetical protein